MDATLIAGALAGGEQAINKALEYDAASRAVLARVSERVVADTVEATDLTVFLAMGRDSVELRQHFVGQPSVHVRGPLPALMSWAGGHQRQLKTTGAQNSGDSVV